MSETDSPAESRLESRDTSATASPWWWIVLVLIVVLGFEIRLSCIDNQSFWYDEVVSVELIQASYGDLFFGRVKDNGNPPLFWLALKASVSAFGDDLTAYRMFSVLCGTGVVLLVGLFGREIVGDRPALIAAALMAVSPYALELSADARAYSLLMLLAVGNGWAFHRWLRTRSSLAFITYVLTMALVCLTHYYALMLPVVHLLTLLFMPKGNRPVLRWFGGMVAVGGVALLWLPAFIEQVTRPGNLVRMEEAWYRQFMGTPLVFGFGRSLVWRESSTLILGLISVLAVMLFWFIAAVGVRAHLRSGAVTEWLKETDEYSLSKAETVLLGSWTLLPVLIPLGLALAGHPLYNVRYPSFAIPALLLLVGRGAMTISLPSRFVWGTAVAGLSALAVWNYATKPLMDDWSRAVTVLNSEENENVPVLVDSDYQAKPLMFYTSRRDIPVGPVFGLEGINPESGALSAVQFRSEDPAARKFQDRSAAVLKHQEFWLFFCIPNDDPEKYLQYFTSRGYSVAEERSFHRIDALRFVRSAQIVHSTGSAGRPE